MPPDSPLTPILTAIDAAHALDPTKTTISGQETPYELHYAQKCTSYLDKRCPTASPALRVAIRAQHFRRWEVSRNTYPMTRVGYHAWRSFLKKRQAELVLGVLAETYDPVLDEPYASEPQPEGNGPTSPFMRRVASLMRKEGLKEGDEEAAVLEDVACLVFLDDQFEKYAEKWGEEDMAEEKVLGILRKTWGKMTERGHELALQIPMEGRAKDLLQKALAG